jgi:hypothetical protein
MAVYNPIQPPIFLNGEITQVISVDTYPYDDNSGLAAAGAKLTYQIDVVNIASQTVGTADVRTGNLKEYTAIDLKTGDWVTNQSGEILLQIISVLSKTDGSISFIAKDVDMITYKTYAQNAFSTGDSIAFFEVSDNGQPLITGDIAFFPTPLAIDKIQGRFAALEETERYRLEYVTEQSQVDKGDAVTVNSATGALVKLDSEGASDVPLGIVIEKSMGDRVVYVKPFNTIIDNHPNPEQLTGSIGDIYYSDPANPGQITTTKTTGSKALFLQVTDPIPTVIRSTESNYLPDANDSLVINNITVFDGALNIALTTVQDLANLINTNTSIHKVSAVSEAAFATVSTSAPANGDVLLCISDSNGSTYDPISVTISDGTNSTTVTFDENQGANLVEFPGAPGYLCYDAVDIATVLNAAFTTDGLDLYAEAIPGTGANPSLFEDLKITATVSSASIEITNIDADVVAQSFTDGTGLAASTPASSEAYLVMTRADGGDVLITATKGDYVNFNGITSSSAGSAAILLMLEGVGEQSEVGVNVSVDKNQTVSAATTHDHFVTGINIDYTPFQDGDVIVKINGLEVNIGDGTNAEDCYFTDPNDAAFNTNGDPMVAKLIKDIAAGDVLIWNPTYANYSLDTNDDIDIIYQASSADL